VISPALVASDLPSGLLYPPSRQGDDSDEHHGEHVPDPYRWLEDTTDEETRAWAKAQNELTEAVLAAIGTRVAIRTRLVEKWNFPRFGVPLERGGRWFQARNTGLQNQPVLYVMDSPEDEGRELLDPNVLSGEGTVAVSATSVSPDGSKLAYATSSSGSDWMTWHVRDVASGEDLDDCLHWSKSLAAEWAEDSSGFYYSAMPPPLPGREYLDQSSGKRIFFHRTGTPQEEDELVFEPEDAGLWPDIDVSSDGRYLVLYLSRGIGPEIEIRVLELARSEEGFRVLVPAGDSKAVVVANDGDEFFVLTDEGAPRGRIVAASLERAGTTAWREVVPTGADTLLEVHHFGGRLVCHHLQDACSLLRVFELDGTFVRDIPLPEMSTLSGSQIEHEMIEGTSESDIVHFEVESFTESASLWRHDLGSGSTTLVRAATSALPRDEFVTERVFVPSPDGTLVPLFLTRSRNTRPDGEIPVLLYGYGGVGIPITPAHSVPWTVFVERGGMLAVASLRGGGEYGRAWHEAGRRANKQNVFDDFCACARWLASSGWSRPGRIAINGGSNGGLLVGASMTQHPELFGAVVVDVGVLDMLRFDRFTIGWAWRTEYGDPEDPEQYRWLRSYSPLHNLRPGRYPATLVTTGDHDDRVVPGHSFKFTAALQAAQLGERPVLLRVESAAGHGAGKPTSKAIDAATDFLSFLDAALQMGVGSAS
jgi:prolyl oligopeptidase